MFRHKMVEMLRKSLDFGDKWWKGDTKGGLTLRFRYDRLRPTEKLNRDQSLMCLAVLPSGETPRVGVGFPSGLRLIALENAPTVSLESS